jgi:hypothetical protein
MLARALTMKALATLGVLTLGAAGAAAATGSLPTAAQDGLANAATHVGVTLPASHDNHPTKDSHPGQPAAAPSSPTSVANHGTDVSGTARTTDATGADKGAVISAVARGDHGRPAADDESDGDAAEDATVPTTGAPVPTPNAGGIGTGSTASDDANSAGATHAAPQAAEGSANAGDHPTGP